MSFPCSLHGSKPSAASMKGHPGGAIYTAEPLREAIPPGSAASHPCPAFPSHEPVLPRSTAPGGGGAGGSYLTHRTMAHSFLHLRTGHTVGVSYCVKPCCIIFISAPLYGFLILPKVLVISTTGVTLYWDHLHCGSFLLSLHSRHTPNLNGVMVNFKGQLGWAKGCPGCWQMVFLGVSVRVPWEERSDL